MNNGVWDRFVAALWADIDEKEEFWSRKPHLAHYTSIAAMHKILESDEIWLSNPLYMNDHEEVAFGIHSGLKVVSESEAVLSACRLQKRREIVLHAFDRAYRQFANEHVLDTYVFCLSELRSDDNDGLLSMWRGYGGNGSGIAWVIDTGQFAAVQTSALILARVHYGTRDERIAWLATKVAQFADLLLSEELGDDDLCIAASALFERIKLFALFSKHKGFEEEREWRVVYTPARDPQGTLHPYFGYFVGPRGLEPKLKLKLQPIPDVTAPAFSLDLITDRVILGPTLSSPLAISAFHKLLDGTKHSGLKARVHASGIPFRDRT